MKRTGQCHCGGVAYEYHGDIVKSSYCDCRGCQRATGTLKAPFVKVSAESFVLKSGVLSHFRRPSGEMCDAHGEWYFCPTCGTQIYWKPNQGAELDVFAGTLDDASVFRPAE